MTIPTILAGIAFLGLASPLSFAALLATTDERPIARYETLFAQQ